MHFDYKHLYKCKSAAPALHLPDILQCHLTSSEAVQATPKRDGRILSSDSLHRLFLL